MGILSLVLAWIATTLFLLRCVYLDQQEAAEAAEASGEWMTPEKLRRQSRHGR